MAAVPIDALLGNNWRSFSTNAIHALRIHRSQQDWRDVNEEAATGAASVHLLAELLEEFPQIVDVPLHDLSRLLCARRLGRSGT